MDSTGSCPLTAGEGTAAPGPWFSTLHFLFEVMHILYNLIHFFDYSNLQNKNTEFLIIRPL